MKNILKALMLSLLFMINTGVIEAQVDDSKAKITFLFIDKDVQGSISDIQTDIKIDKSIVSNSYMKGSVGVTTIKTGNFLRDGHLMWKKYFYEKAFPKISFESTAISEKDGKLLVTGLLTVKETSKSIEISFEQNEGSLIGTARINTYDYGIKISKTRDENIVDVFFDLPLK